METGTQPGPTSIPLQRLSPTRTREQLLQYARECVEMSNESHGFIFVHRKVLTESWWARCCMGRPVVDEYVGVQYLKYPSQCYITEIYENGVLESATIEKQGEVDTLEVAYKDGELDIQLPHWGRSRAISCERQRMQMDGPVVVGFSLSPRFSYSPRFNVRTPPER